MNDKRKKRNKCQLRWQINQGEGGKIRAVYQTPLEWAPLRSIHDVLLGQLPLFFFESDAIDQCTFSL